MKMRPTLLILPAALVAAALSLSADGASSAAAPVGIGKPSLPEKTAAEQRFADAPFGVDPIVTGPRTAPFRERQKRAGCGKAAWPDIPVACYPG